MPRVVNGHKFRTFADTWEDSNFLTPEEKALIELKVELFGAFSEALEREGWTQTQLAKEAHMTQSEISRLIKVDANPKVDTLLRAAIPLGYKLRLVPCE